MTDAKQKGVIAEIREAWKNNKKNFCERHVEADIDFADSHHDYDECGYTRDCTHGGDFCTGTLEYVVCRAPEDIKNLLDIIDDLQKKLASK